MHRRRLRARLQRSAHRHGRHHADDRHLRRPRRDRRTPRRARRRRLRRPGPAERDGRHRDHPGRSPRARRTTPRRRSSCRRSATSRPSIEDDYGTPIAVTGYTAVAIDISNRLTDALVPFALIVVGLSIVLLLIVFRSVFVPIKAALGFLLSAFAAHRRHRRDLPVGLVRRLPARRDPGPILSFLPILLMAVLFGLAMDYEVFLVSGMREEFVKTKRAALVDRARLPARRARGDRGRAHHVLRLLRLRARGLGRDQGHRVRARRSASPSTRSSCA